MKRFQNLIARTLICDTATRTANATSETTRGQAESSPEPSKVGPPPNQNPLFLRQTVTLFCYDTQASSSSSTPNQNRPIFAPWMASRKPEAPCPRGPPETKPVFSSATGRPKRPPRRPRGPERPSGGHLRPPRHPPEAPKRPREVPPKDLMALGKLLVRMSPCIACASVTLRCLCACVSPCVARARLNLRPLPRCHPMRLVRLCGLTGHLFQPLLPLRGGGSHPAIYPSPGSGRGGGATS